MKIGDTIRSNVTVEELRPTRKPGRSVAAFRFVVMTQDDTAVQRGAMRVLVRAFQVLEPKPGIALVVQRLSRSLAREEQFDRLSNLVEESKAAALDGAPICMRRDTGRRSSGRSLGLEDTWPCAALGAVRNYVEMHKQDFGIGCGRTAA